MQTNHFYDATIELLKKLNICPQCRANATSNYAAGYLTMASDCVEYCLREHVSEKSDIDQLTRTGVWKAETSNTFVPLCRESNEEKLDSLLRQLESNNKKEKL